MRSTWIQKWPRGCQLQDARRHTGKPAIISALFYGCDNAGAKSQNATILRVKVGCVLVLVCNRADSSYGRASVFVSVRKTMFVIVRQNVLLFSFFFFFSVLDEDDRVGGHKLIRVSNIFRTRVQFRIVDGIIRKSSYF